MNIIEGSLLEMVQFFARAECAVLGVVGLSLPLVGLQTLFPFSAKPVVVFSFDIGGVVEGAIDDAFLSIWTSVVGDFLCVVMGSGLVCTVLGWVFFASILVRVVGFTVDEVLGFSVHCLCSPSYLCGFFFVVYVCIDVVLCGACGLCGDTCLTLLGE